MKVETPQILWHNGSEGNGKPAPLYSVSLLPTSTNIKDGDILATAGNTNEVHIWNITFPLVKPPSSAIDDDETQQNKRRKILTPSTSIIKHVTTITRHQRSVNIISFSPFGNHLATAGDGGSFIIHTVPSNYRRSEVTRNHFWKKVLSSEKDLNIKVINTHAEDVMDLSWSSDEKRLILGSLDHSVFIFEECFHNPNATTSPQQQQQPSLGNGAVNVGRLDQVGSSNSWKCVWRNTKEHTHYVQGVAFDPLGIYLASQGSDRSVRVWQRKRGNKKNAASKKKVLTTMDSNANENALSENTHGVSQARNTNSNTTNTSDPFIGKFEVGKAKMLKYRSLDKDGVNSINENSATSSPTPVKKRYLFADESSVESFFRRLAWTNDGAFLITPASLWHPSDTHDANNSSIAETKLVDSSTTPFATSSPSFATHLFARHQYEQPFKVLFGLEKPSVAIRPNPLFFKLPKDVHSYSKENMQQRPSSMSNNLTGNIPYRSIFAVLTIDSILIYDTYHSRPLAVARGLHYAGLTDCTWSSDGKNLIVCSTDGYISILSFAEGELGEVCLTPTSTPISTRIASNEAKDVADDSMDPQQQNFNPLQQSNQRRRNKAMYIQNTLSPTRMPPCEPGQSATLVAPPSKRAKFDTTHSKGEKKRVTPVLLSGGSNVDELKTEQQQQQQRQDQQGLETMEIQQGASGNANCMETEVVGAVTNLSLNNELHGIGSVC